LKIIIHFILVCISYGALAQINTDQYESKYGKGDITFKKKVKISFIYDPNIRTYYAKVTHQIDRLTLSDQYSSGLVQVPFNTFQRLNLKKARYFKLDSLGEKILVENVKVKYADEKDYFISGIFYNDLKVKQFLCSVNLPENYFSSYSYDLYYDDLKFITAFYLQEKNEAVKEVEISIKKDVNVELSIFEQNLGDKITRTEDDNYIKYKAKSLDRIKSNENSVKGSYYLPHIILSVKSTETPEKETFILRSTEDQYNWYKSLLKELRPDDLYIKKLSQSIVKGASTNEKKIEAIYSWVQNNIQYIAFEDGIAGFKPTEADKVSKLKYGDCKGMANLLVNLLKAEGFDAKHTWIGTRNNNYSYDIPSLIVDNHMICALDFQNKRYYLDGTSKSASWNSPPPSLEGKQVLIANGENFLIDSVKISSANNNQIKIDGILDLSSTQPKIKINVELSGHYKQDYISYLKYIPSRSKKNIPYYLISDYIDGITIEDISDAKLNGEKVQFSISGFYSNLVKGTNSNTVFPFLNTFNYSTINKNQAPIYIDYPHHISVKLQLKNAKGKLKDATDFNQKIAYKSSYANFEIQKDADEYTIIQELHINTQHSPLVGYTEWNNFANRIKLFNTHPITYGIDE
jgi:hypothetical protein